MAHDRPEQPASDHTQAMVKLAKLWSSAMPALDAFVRAAVRDAHDCDDIIQATGEFVASHFHEFEEGTSFTGWTITIARFRIRELYRDRSRDRLVLTGEAIDAIAEVAQDTGELVNARRNALNDCLDQLPPRQRKLMEMRYLQDLKPRVIADRIGRSPNTISAALMRVRKALHRCIDQQLGHPSRQSGEVDG